MSRTINFDFDSFRLSSFKSSVSDISFDESIYHVRIHNAYDSNIDSILFYTTDFNGRDQFIKNMFSVINYKISFLKGFYGSDNTFSISISSNPVINLSDGKIGYL